MLKTKGDTLSQLIRLKWYSSLCHSWLSLFAKDYARTWSSFSGVPLPLVGTSSVNSLSHSGHGMNATSAFEVSTVATVFVEHLALKWHFLFAFLAGQFQGMAFLTSCHAATRSVHVFLWFYRLPLKCGLLFLTCSSSLIARWFVATPPPWLCGSYNSMKLLMLFFLLLHIA